MLVDADQDVLCQFLHRGSHEVELIQSACQRHIDDRDEYNEARSLLQLVQKDLHSTTIDDDDTMAKRKRRK